MKQNAGRYSSQNLTVEDQNQYTESYFDEDEPNPDDGLFLLAIGLWVAFVIVIICVVVFILLQAIF